MKSLWFGFACWLRVRAFLRAVVACAARDFNFAIEFMPAAGVTDRAQINPCYWRTVNICFEQVLKVLGAEWQRKSAEFSICKVDRRYQNGVGLGWAFCEATALVHVFSLAQTARPRFIQKEALA